MKKNVTSDYVKGINTDGEHWSINNSMSQFLNEKPNHSEDWITYNADVIQKQLLNICHELYIKSNTGKLFLHDVTTAYTCTMYQ